MFCPLLFKKHLLMSRFFKFFLRYEFDRLKLLIMGHFLPFYSLTPLKIIKKCEFWKNENNCWIYHHFTHVYQWGTVLEILSETTRIFCHFGPFLALLTSSNLENKNFEKMKKASGSEIILHTGTKNSDHMMHASCDKECDRHKFLLFGAIFCPFTPLLSPKKKYGKTVKKPGDIILLHRCTRNEDHTYGFYSLWDIKARWTEFVDILGHFLPFDPPNNKKKTYTCVPQMTIIWCMVPETVRYGAQQNFLSFWAIFCS